MVIKTSEQTKSFTQKARQESVFNLFRYLKKASTQSPPLADTLMRACTNQASLAKFELADEAIIPMSLNTLKRTADEILGEGGWQKIDVLRMIVRRSAAKETASKRLSPLAASRAHTARIETRNDEQFQTRAILYRAYNAAVDLLYEFADDEPERLEKITRLQAQYADIFDLRLTGRS
ncbi:hypothetical protein [Paraburkholderia sp. BR13444]|uniref:hypothetical protein n=1 Tax=Paraburkholderia sp. BR13444 TaxID=3236997 RepID=UPI0034CEE7EA